MEQRPQGQGHRPPTEGRLWSEGKTVQPRAFRDLHPRATPLAPAGPPAPAPHTSNRSQPAAWIGTAKMRQSRMRHLPGQRSSQRQAPVTESTMQRRHPLLCRARPLWNLVLCRTWLLHPRGPRLERQHLCRGSHPSLAMCMHLGGLFAAFHPPALVMWRRKNKSKLASCHGTTIEEVMDAGGRPFSGHSSGGRGRRRGK